MGFALPHWASRAATTTSCTSTCRPTKGLSQPESRYLIGTLGPFEITGILNHEALMGGKMHGKNDPVQLTFPATDALQQLSPAQLDQADHLVRANGCGRADQRHRHQGEVVPPGGCRAIARDVMDRPGRSPTFGAAARRIEKRRRSRCGAVSMRLWQSRRDHSASNTPAAPMPVPMHMVTMPYFCLRRRMPCTRVAMRTAPVAPSGWPSAMAPPSGLTLAGSRLEVAHHRQRLRGEGFVELDPVQLILA